MSLADEIRNEIENIKELKITVGDINNHLSVLEGLTRKDIEEREKEAYQRGFDDAHRISEEEYQRGLDDAWKTAKKIALMDTETSENVTGYFGLFRIMENLTPMQAIEKLKAYEEHKDDSIKVGDEVIWKTDDITLIVTSTYKNGGSDWCDGVAQDGKVYHTLAENNQKTGKHYDIQSILEAMRK